MYMPRKNSSSNSSTFNKPFSLKEATKFKPIVPPPIHSPPMYSPPMYFPKPTLFDAVKQGFGFGIGSSIARSFMEPTKKINNNNINNDCDSIKNEYNKCMLENKYNDSKNTCYNLEKEYEQCKI